MLRPKVTLLYSFLVAYVLSGQAQSVFNIPKCANRSVFTIGSNNQFSMTCTGLRSTSNIYWSISSPITNFTEIRLGECDACHPKCATTDCSIFNRTDYTITRHQSAVTTLTFVDNLEQNQGALIKCSQLNNHTNSQAYCATVFINATRLPEFKILECSNGVVEILPSQTVSLTCTGLWPLSNIYWSLTGPSTNHTEVRLADCPSCYPYCSSTGCTDYDGRYNISRSRYDVTTLKDVHLQDGSTVKCSQLNNDTTAQSICAISVFQAYRLPQCEDGQLDVSTEETWTAIRCEGLSFFHNITWTLTDAANQTTDIASCLACTDCNKACTVTTDDVKVSRTEAASELRIIGKMIEKNKNTVTCVRQDGATGDSCRLRVFGAGSSAFPLIPVAGGGGAALLVIVIVIVVVFVAAMRKKRKKRQPNNEEHVNASYDGNNEMEVTLVNGAAPTNNGVAMTTDAIHTAACADNYTYIEIDDNEDLKNSTDIAKQAKRVVIQSDDPAIRQPKGENRDEGDFEEYINELYDRTDNVVLINGKTSSSPNPTSPPNTNVSKPGRQIPSQPSTTAFSATNGLFKIDDDVSYDNNAGSSVIGPKGDAYTQVYKVKKAQPLHAKHEKAGNSRGEAAQTQTTEEPSGRTREQSKSAMTTTPSADDETEYANTSSCSTTECPDDTVYVNVGDTDTNAVNATDGPEDAQCPTDNRKDRTSRDGEYNRLGFTRPQLQDDPHYNHLSQL